MMKTLFFICTLLCIGAGLHAQTYTVSGTVTNKQTGEPLHSAVVELEGKGGHKQKTLSGLNGVFVFKNVPAGEYELETKYVGFTKGELNISVPGNATNVQVALEEQKEQLKEVKVNALRNNGTDASAFLADRRAPSIQNSVSARTIEISPDLSVANVTQRVSGVSLERSANGEGQYAILRGMDKRYNYTLVNGVKITSPDNKNRYVPLDIFPADLLDRLEVTKALTPNMEGDAIGGVVNMIMKDAPAKFSIKADGALGYSASLSNNDFQTFDHSASLNRSPRFTNGNGYSATMASFPNNAFSYSSKSNPVATLFGVSAGGRLLNNKLGVLVAGSYQNNYRFVNSTFFGTDVQNSSNDVAITDIQTRKYSIQQQRTGLNAKLDYKIDGNNKINLYAAYFNLMRNDMRNVSDTNLQLGRTIPGSGRVENSYHGIHDVQQVLNVNLNGEHSFGNGFGFNWAAVYSKAVDNRPDEATLNLVTGVSVDPNTHQFVQAPLNLDPSSTREFRHSSDEDKSGYLNFSYDSKLGSGIKALWSVGGMYRNKDRKSSYDEYKLRPDPGIQVYDGNINNNTFFVFNPQGTSDNALNYTATENVGAAYAMVKLNAGKLEVVGGARYENTDLSWSSEVPKTVEGKTGSVKYYDVLPSVHFKYAISRKQALRLSYYSSISRPNFYEVVPHTVLEIDGDYTEKGNPMLKRTTADNFDLRYEYFPHGLDQLLAGVFYKNLKNPIEYALENEGTNVYYKPDNFGTARNLGFELDVTKYFRKFGFKANYTFTDSKITTGKASHMLKPDGSGDTSINVSQTRPLQGQSKHIANASLLFKDDNKLGLNAQLAFGYTSRRINTVSQYVDGDLWQKGFAQLDLSAEKRLAKRWYIYGKINNLLNTPYELEVLQKAKASNVTGVPYQKVGDNIFIRKDTYGINYLLGVKFKM